MDACVEGRRGLRQGGDGTLRDGDRGLDWRGFSGQVNAGAGRRRDGVGVVYEGQRKGGARAVWEGDWCDTDRGRGWERFSDSVLTGRSGDAGRQCLRKYRMREEQRQGLKGKQEQRKGAEGRRGRHRALAVRGDRGRARRGSDSRRGWGMGRVGGLDAEFGRDMCEGRGQQFVGSGRGERFREGVGRCQGWGGVKG